MGAGNVKVEDDRGEGEIERCDHGTGVLNGDCACCKSRGRKAEGDGVWCDRGNGEVGGGRAWCDRGLEP